MNFEPNFDLIDGIKIYDGTTSFSRIELNKRIVYFQSLIDFDNVLFSDLLPSTLSVRGNMLGVNFHEEELIKNIWADGFISSWNFDTIKKTAFLFSDSCTYFYKSKSTEDNYIQFQNYPNHRIEYALDDETYRYQ